MSKKEKKREGGKYKNLKKHFLPFFWRGEVKFL